MADLPPTSDPVPSKQAVDFLFNAKAQDVLINGAELTFEDRLGNERKTWAGIEQGLGAEYAITQTGANRLAVEAAREEVDELAAAAQAAAQAQRVYATWSALAAAPGDTAGLGALVRGDDGTHTDPVTSAQVPNSGLFRWNVSPAGWQWLSADPAVTKVDKTEYNARLPKAAPPGRDWAVADEYGRVLVEGDTEAGVRTNAARVGQLRIAGKQDEDAAQMYPDGAAPGALSVVDAYGRVGFAVPPEGGGGDMLAPVGDFIGGTSADMADQLFMRGRESVYGNREDIHAGLGLRKVGFVVQPNAVQAWRAEAVESPKIWREDDLRYHMVFTAYSAGHAEACHGHATSVDLVNWDVDPVPFFTGSGVVGAPDRAGCTGPYPLKYQGTYYLYYIGLTESGYEAGEKTLCCASAPSLDGPWTRHGKIIDKGEIGTVSDWRALQVWHPSVTSRRGVFYMFFNASGSDAKERIGYATSSHPLGPWTVHDEDCPLLTDIPGGWHDMITGDPSVYRDGDRWIMEFFGYGYIDGVLSACDGIAWTTDAEFPLGWREIPGNPILMPSKPHGIDATFSHKPFIHISAGRKYHYYTSATQLDGSEYRAIALAVSDVAADRTFLGDMPETAARVARVHPACSMVDRYEPVLYDAPTLTAGVRQGGYEVRREADATRGQLRTFRSDGSGVELTSGAVLAVDATEGFAYLPTIAGTPTGAPPTKVGGVAVAVDPAANKLWLRIGSAWKFVSLS